MKHFQVAAFEEPFFWGGLGDVGDNLFGAENGQPTIAVLIVASHMGFNLVVSLALLSRKTLVA